MKNNHLNKGTRKDFAFVFSTPGQKEELHSKPVSGKTGENLEILLKFLKDEMDEPYGDRYDFRITNSFPKVLYRKKDGRTEPNLKDILQIENIERLKTELRDIEKYVIFFGEKAKSTAIYLTELKAKFIFCQHLSPSSIIQLKLPLLKNKPKLTTTEQRLFYISEVIKRQL